MTTLILHRNMEKGYQIRVIIAGGGVVGLVLANALEVRMMFSSELFCMVS
jgi:hypothetical protein